MIVPHNQLIDRLSTADRAAILAATQEFEFGPGYVFSESGGPVTFVHFVYVGIASAVATMEDGRTVETFMVGREGAVDLWAVDVPLRGVSRMVAQVPGRSRRIEAGKLRALMDERPGLRETLRAYALGLVSELEQSIACNALHRADQRFAKWLLRCHDRTDGDVIPLTQESLASMLGSQRTTVNEAAQQLQRLGALSYSRGKVMIRDRRVLERQACECYASPLDRQATAEPDETES